MLRSGELGRMLSIDARPCGKTGGRAPSAPGANSRRSRAAASCSTPARTCSTPSPTWPGEDFVEVAAWLDNSGRPVDTLGMVMGQLASGAYVTMHGCGEAIRSCASDVRVFCEQRHPAHRHLGRSGSKSSAKAASSSARVPVPASLGVWEQFLAVRDGTHGQPLPARSRAAHGAAVGRDQGVGGAGWKAGQSLTSPTSEL